jgi:hypothetical protein
VQGGQLAGLQVDVVVVLVVLDVLVVVVVGHGACPQQGGQFVLATLLQNVRVVWPSAVPQKVGGEHTQFTIVVVLVPLVLDVLVVVLVVVADGGLMQAATGKMPPSQQYSNSKYGPPSPGQRRTTVGSPSSSTRETIRSFTS